MAASCRATGITGTGAALVALAVAVAVALLGPVAYGRAADGKRPGARPDEGSAAPATPPQVSWSFAGILGRYDHAQLRRGFQVYQQVCSNCHSMRFVAFRDLRAIGYDAAAVKAIAAATQVDGGVNDAGEPVKRPGRPSDAFPSPYPSAAAAVAAFGAVPPDMSTLAAAHDVPRPFPLVLLDVLTGGGEAGGADYIHAVLNGYTRDDEPTYNIYVPGRHLAMPKPLSDGQVTDADGRPRTLAQSSTDVAAFLAWAADPTLDERKALGLRVMGFLLVFATLLFFVKRRVWARVGGDVVVGAHPDAASRDPSRVENLRGNAT